MFISRFWTLLLVIAGAILLSVLMLARDLVNNERQEHSEDRIYAKLNEAAVGFKLHARERIDLVRSISDDQEVQKYIAEAASSSKKRDEVRPKLLTTLNKLNGNMKQFKADMLLAIDRKGDVVVQAGTKGRANEFNLSGMPTVDAAMRGVVRDDVWKLGEKVYLIAARPVILGNSYVGAIIHGMVVNDALASQFSGSTKTQIAYYSGKMMIAIGKPTDADVAMAPENAISSALTDIEAQKAYQQSGISDAVRVGSDDQEFLAIYSRVKGEARENGVGWVVVSPVAPSIELTSIHQKAAKEDVDKIPFTSIIGASLLLLLLGWLWPYLEAERPVSKLHKAIAALETADVKDQLNVYKYKRSVRKIATAFNKVVDVKLREVMNGMGGSAGKSVDAILGDQDSVRLSSASFKFAEDMSDDIPAPPSALDAPPPDAKPKPVAGIQPTPPGGANRPPTKPQKPLGAPPAAAPAGASPDEKVYFQQIHKEFVALKQKLGESTDGLTFERFEVTLKKNRDALKARYGCQSVKFNVYEKDGKASLKAIPVKA